MSRTRNERQHYTDRYQARQIRRKGPFKDYKRRPLDTFIWELMGYEIYPRYLLNGPEDYPNQEQLGYYRNHSAFSCSCHTCRSYRDADWNWESRWKKYKTREWKQEQDYQDGIKEYFLDDKY